MLPRLIHPSLRSVRGLGLIAALLVTVVLGMSGCERESADADAETAREDGSVELSEREVKVVAKLGASDEPPVDETNAYATDERAARLGQFLFFDERLSGNGEVSCASCHQPEHGFSMPARLGAGIGETLRHPPSLLNAAYHHWYNWDGRADTLWAQAVGPLEDPNEHGFNRLELAHLIAGDEQLRRAYEQIFGPLPELADTDRFPPAGRPVASEFNESDEPEHPHHVAWESMTDDDQAAVNRVLANTTKAIAAYQTKLVQNDAPFDRFVEGLVENDEAKTQALSEPAKRGLKLFVGEANCVNCHTGSNFTDGSFHNLGLAPREWMIGSGEGRWDGGPTVKKDIFNAAGDFSDDPDGKRAQWLRYLTRTPEDHGQFKTPTLRNVELTAPYMHGGHFETLEEVVQFYSTLPEQNPIGHREEMLVPLGLDAREIDDLVAFLKSLTGRPLPADLTEQPDSPMLPEAAASSD